MGTTVFAGRHAIGPFAVDREVGHAELPLRASVRRHRAAPGPQHVRTSPVGAPVLLLDWEVVATVVWVLEWEVFTICVCVLDCDH